MLINGEEYTTSQHGFARDSVFECVESTDSMVSFLLTSSEETKKKYPFDFKLFINYYLDNKEVKVEWKVENTGNETMYFTIGAHPAFRFAKKDEVKSDYILKFPGKDQLEYILVDKETEDGMGTAIPEEKRTLKLENNTYVLNEEIFDNDALILDGCKGATYYAIALSVSQIAEAILRDTKMILTVSTLQDGSRYGVKDVCLSLPCVVGANGIEREITPPLLPEEEEAVRKSAAALREVIDAMKAE